MSIKVLIYNEYVHELESAEIAKIYPNGIHGALGEIFQSDEFIVHYAVLADIETTITEEILNDTDVLLWWGHVRHAEVPDSVAKLVTDAVKKGMGFIPLHSAHFSKPMIQLLGTACTLRWREETDRERLWVSAPYHPIAKDIPEHFELDIEEMYGEPFDIPNAEDTVFIGWFSGGDVFRSGVTFRRGCGKIFYFQPGHESHPTFHNPTIRSIIKNAVLWAKPEYRRTALDCPNSPALEK